MPIAPVQFFAPRSRARSASTSSFFGSSGAPTQRGFRFAAALASSQAFPPGRAFRAQRRRSGRLVRRVLEFLCRFGKALELDKREASQCRAAAPPPAPNQPAASVSARAASRFTSARQRS